MKGPRTEMGELSPETGELSPEDLALMEAFELRTGESASNSSPLPLDSKQEAELQRWVVLHERIEQMPVAPVAPGVRRVVMSIAAQQASSRREGPLVSLFAWLLRPTPLVAVGGMIALAVALSVRLGPKETLQGRGQPEAEMMAQVAPESVAEPVSVEPAAAALDHEDLGSREQSAPLNEGSAGVLPRPRRTIETHVADMGAALRERARRAREVSQRRAAGGDVDRAEAPPRAEKVQKKKKALVGLMARAPHGKRSRFQPRSAKSRRPSVVQRGSPAAAPADKKDVSPAFATPGEARFALPPPSPSKAPKATSSGAAPSARAKGAAPSAQAKKAPAFDELSPRSAPAPVQDAASESESLRDRASKGVEENKRKKPSKPTLAELKETKKRILALLAVKEDKLDHAEIHRLLLKLRDGARQAGMKDLLRWAQTRLEAR